MKLLTIVMVLLFIGSFCFIVWNNMNQYERMYHKFNCDEFGLVYLKPSELSQAEKIANKINGVVVIPELNQLIGRTEVLDCSNFDYRDYINLGEEK